MFKSIGKQVKGYLLLLRERPARKLSRRKLKKLRKKEAKQSKIILKTKGGEVIEKPVPGLPEINACKNCGAQLQGNFCHLCGQKDSDYRRPYWTLVEDFSDNVFSKDSRLWRTLGYLLFFPGAMTREYIAGRRIRFLPPIRTFLISIIMFFLTINVLDVAIVKFTGEAVTYDQRLAVLQTALSEQEAKVEKYAAADETGKLAKAIRSRGRALGRIEGLEEWRADKLAESDQSKVRRTGQGYLIYDYDIEPKMFAPITSEDQALPEGVIEDTFQFDTGGDDDDPEFLTDLAPKVQRGLKNAARDPRRLNNALNNWVPLIMAIFIPLFAIFLRFFYWKREHYIYNHLVFSLHFHTYLFFVLTFFVIAQVYLGSAVSTWMFFGAAPLYLFIALKIATGQGWFRTFFKFLVISLFYIIGFSIMLGTIFIFAFAEA